jgi:formyltetrahydrofolate deformylase
MADENDVGRLIVSCRDRHGIVAALASALADLGANITSSAQHSTDPERGMFFLRMEFHLPGLQDGRSRAEERIGLVADQFAMDWRIAPSAERKRVALFVSKQDHCLLDLLWRWQRGELPMNVTAVVSNHPDHRAAVEAFGVPYHHVPVTAETKGDAEKAALELLAGAVDLAVLARYMQVLSNDFLRQIGVPVINIHHSFLPAFAGGNPYARAHERGVKLIGATAHYATADLDEGPIIEQDVVRVTHQPDAGDLARLGRDVERLVLARAVRWHLEDRVLVDGNRTVVFSG